MDRRANLKLMNIMSKILERIKMKEWGTGRANRREFVTYLNILNKKSIRQLQIMDQKLGSKILKSPPSILKVIELQTKENKLTLKDLKFLLVQEERTKELLEAKKHEQQTVTLVNLRNNSATLVDDVESTVKKFTTLKNKLNKAAKEKLPSKVDNPSVYTGLQEISVLEDTSAYITTCSYIKILGDRIESNLKNGSDMEAINFLSQLQLIQNIHLFGTECTSLWNYCSSTSEHWEKQLEIKFTRDFEKVLQKMKWPTRLDILDNDPDLKEKFQKTTRSLVRICKLSLSRVGKETKRSPLLIDFHEPILPIKVMARPLRTRFRYHFFSSKATQNNFKPEWYFSQIKKWAQEIIPFIKVNMDTVTLEEVNTSSIVEFIRTMSELLVLKADSQLSSDSEKISDSVFAKILEESIQFENEIGRLLGDHVGDKQVYIPPFVSTLFSQPHILERWLAIEKRSCFEKLDEVFGSPSAWHRAVVPGPPEIVDLFIAMLRFVTDRFAHLQQPGQRIQFLQLLALILDDFRVRCLQTWKSLANDTGDSYFSNDVLIDYIIADSLVHITKTLERWEDLPFFSSLSFFLRNLRNASQGEGNCSRLEPLEDLEFCDDLLYTSEASSLPRNDLTQKEALIGRSDTGLFTSIQKLYEYAGEEILNKWCNYFVENLREDIGNNYAKKKWHSFPENSKDGYILSQEFLTTFQKCSTVSKAIMSSMNALLAEKWLKRLAVHLDEMLLETVIIPNKFSKGAMKQITFDLVHGLFVVFVECEIRTSIFMSGLNCVIRIWEMPLGEAMLTLESLVSSPISFERQEETIAELELSLRASDVIKILRGRTDMFQ